MILMMSGYMVMNRLLLTHKEVLYMVVSRVIALKKYLNMYIICAWMFVCKMSGRG